MKPKPLQSPPEALAKIDHRRVEARIMAKIEADLSKHCGGAPTIAQQLVISRIAWLGLHLALLDKKAADSGGALSEADAKRYLGWNNAFMRGVRSLGKGAEPKPPSLAEYLERRASEKAASAEVGGAA